LAIPRYTAPGAEEILPPTGEWAADAARSGFASASRADVWASWIRANRRLTQVVVDLAATVTIVLSFATNILPADVMFHVVFVLLTAQAATRPPIAMSANAFRTVPVILLLLDVRDMPHGRTTRRRAACRHST
jgi:hypothetical protein